MKYDLLQIKEKSQSLKIEGSKLNSVKNLSLTKQGLRRFEAGKLYQASLVGEGTVDKLIADSREWGGPGVPHEFGFAPERTEKRKGPTIERDLIQKFQDFALKYMDRYPKFVFNAKATTYDSSVQLKSNYGLDLESTGECLDVVLSYQRKSSGNMVDGWVWTTALDFNNVKAEWEQEEEFLRVHEKEVKIKNGRMPVLLVDNSEAIQTFMDSIELNKYKEGACVFAGKLGQQIFSPEITILDQLYDAKVGSINFFDGDGIVRKNDPLKLVDKGTFANLISDLRWSKKYGVESTGNGHRAYNRGVQLTPYLLRFAPGKKPWREILKGLDQCIVAVLAAGGDSNELGEYSTPVQFGYVFEKGECIGRAPQLTVKTSVTDYLGKNLIAVSSDGFSKGKSSACVISEMDVLVN